MQSCQKPPFFPINEGKRKEKHGDYEKWNRLLFLHPSPSSPSPPHPKKVSFFFGRRRWGHFLNSKSGEGEGREREREREKKKPQEFDQAKKRSFKRLFSRKGGKWGNPVLVKLLLLLPLLPLLTTSTFLLFFPSFILEGIRGRGVQQQQHSLLLFLSGEQQSSRLSSSSSFSPAERFKAISGSDLQGAVGERRRRRRMRGDDLRRGRQRRRRRRAFL